MANTPQLPTNDDQRHGDSPQGDFLSQHGFDPQQQAQASQRAHSGASEDMRGHPNLGEEGQEGEEGARKSSPGLDQIRDNAMAGIGRGNEGTGGIPNTDLRSPEGLQKNDPYLNRQRKKDDKRDKKSARENAKVPTQDLREHDLFHKDDNGGGRFGRLKKLKSKIGKKGGLKIGGGVAVAVFLIFLFIAVASLKLPDVMEGIESYEFAAVSQQFFDDSNNVTDEALAVNINDDDVKGGVFDQLHDRYSDLKNGIWDKVTGDNPDDVIQDMRDNNGLKFRYKSTISGRKILIGGDFDGVAYDVVPPSGIGKWVPGFNKYLKYQGEQPVIGKGGLLEAMNTEMKTNDVSVVPRWTIMGRYIGETEGGLSGFALHQFTDSTPTKTDPDPQEEDAMKEQYDAGEAGDTVPNNSSLAQESDAVNSTEEEEKTIADDPTMVSQDAQNGGDVQALLDAANSQLSDGIITTILHYTGLVYLLFAPLCIAFDGSVVQSGPAISNQMDQVQDAFDQLAAEADQQKQGATNSTDGGELANAVSGAADEVGDISTSIPYQRTYGQVESTDFIPSVEAGSDGTYAFSVFNALGIPADTTQGRLINGVTSSICRVMTSIWASVGLTLAQFALDIFSFGSATAAEGPVEEGVAGFVQRYAEERITSVFATKTVTTITGDEIKTTFMTRAVRFAIGQATVLGATVGLTFLAHLEVASRAGIANDGLNVGSNLVDIADNGAEIEASGVAREQLFGRPLLEAEVAQQEDSNSTYVDYVNSHKSFVQRYFALDNYNSLLTHVGMDLGASDHADTLASIVKLGSSILRPMSAIAGVVGTLTGSSTKAYAAGDPEAYNYGNVIFGWSAAENALIASSDTYKPLENQKILDDASAVGGLSRQDAIAQKYANCFGYDYNPTGNVNDLDPNNTAGGLVVGADATVSDLLTGNGSDVAKIDRDDTTGDVVNGGALCDPDILSYESADPLAADAQTPELNGLKSPQPKDMIFRWRLALAYDTTADQLISDGKINDSGE
jgi:hypothetical protein